MIVDIATDFYLGYLEKANRKEGYDQTNEYDQTKEVEGAV